MGVVVSGFEVVLLPAKLPLLFKAVLGGSNKSMRGCQRFRSDLDPTNSHQALGHTSDPFDSPLVIELSLNF